MLSNGTICTPKTILDLTELSALSNFFSFQVSLDSHSPSINDITRGKTDIVPPLVANFLDETIADGRTENYPLYRPLFINPYIPYIIALNGEILSHSQPLVKEIFIEDRCCVPIASPGKDKRKVLILPGHPYCRGHDSAR